jgi:putative transposase
MLPFLAPIDRRPTRGLKRWTACRNRCTCLSLRHNTLSSTIEVLRRPVESAQYTSHEFAQYCTKNGIRRSLGKTGICYDNAASKSFFATYKKDLIHTRPWPTVKHLTNETFDWIETYYNTQRRHSTLEYLTPREYELGYRNISDIAA